MPRGFSAAGKATNWTRSEMNRIFTNNGTKHNTVNGNDVSRGSHVSDKGIFSDVLPLQDVTNSSSASSDTTAIAKPHFSQPRVYDLVAGKKSKKGKRQQPRKTAQMPQKKKPSTSEGLGTTEGEYKEQVVSDDDDRSLTLVKNTSRLCHGKASGHNKNSGELVSEYNV